MNIQNIINHAKNYGLYLIILVVGIVIGGIFFDTGSHTTVENTHSDNHDNTVWSCSMHPQIRENTPGKCPICGMDLVPLENEEGNPLGDFQVRLSENARKIANVSTEKVKKQEISGALSLSGKIIADERNIAEISSHIKGRIEKLNVNFTGQKVYRGQVLATIYSPELVSAQQELLQAVKLKGTRPEFYNAAVQKLRLWELSESQIENIEKSGKVSYDVPILSPISGTVTDRKISLGEHVMDGSVMFEVTNLNKLWVVFDAYESDLAWINKGQLVNYSVKSLPGREFEAKITFIDPFLDPDTRVAGVRAEINNRSGEFKPDMLVKGSLEYAPNMESGLIIPASAILWTGKTSVVYVKEPFNDGVFSYREIETGPQVGNSFIVKSGLHEGEEIAVNGVFKIDAAAQLQGKKSMMNDLVNNDNQEDQIPVLTVSDKTKDELQTVVENYLVLKNSLIDSDEEGSKSTADIMLSSIEAIDMKTMGDEAHEYWMDAYMKIKKALQNTQRGDIEQVRKEFAVISSELFNVAKAFQLQQIDLYYQFCPMVNDNTGAWWISTKSEIENPYYGEAMLTCGSNTDSLIVEMN